MASSNKFPVPPLDPELQVLLTKLNVPIMPPTLEAIRASRGIPSPGPGIEEILAAHPSVVHTEQTLPNNGPILSIFQPRPLPIATPESSSSAKERLRPCMYYIHGGGMIRGTRFTLLNTALSVLESCDAVVTSIEYRLAPEHPYPAGLDDCSAGLAWVFEHAEELGIDASKVMVAGHSGAACLAAGMLLRSRDAKRGVPAAKTDGIPAISGEVCGLFLGCPMLDDRNVTVSSHQFAEPWKIWNRRANLMAWSAVLGGEENVGREDISPYAVPARAEDLSDMPNTYIDVGSSDLLRDEAVDFASKLWAAGINAELHVWPGGFHGFEILAFTATLSGLAREVQMHWFKRVFGL